MTEMNINQYLKSKGLRMLKRNNKYTKKAESIIQEGFYGGEIDYLINNQLYDPVSQEFVDNTGQPNKKFRILPPNTFTVKKRVKNDGGLLKQFLKSKNPSGLQRLIVKQGDNIKYDNSINFNEPINSWWRENHKSFMIGDSADQNWIWGNESTTFILTPYESLDYTDINQLYRNSDNGLCFFNPIVEYLQEQKEIVKSKSSMKKINGKLNMITGKQLKGGFKEGFIHKFKNGVNHEDIIEICKDLNIGIEILNPLNCECYFEFRPPNKRKQFTYLNSSFNHLESSNVINKFDTIRYSSGEQITKTKEELEALIKDIKEPCLYSKNKFGVSRVYKNNEVYSLSFEGSNILKEFKESINFYSIKFKGHKHPKIQQYIKNSVHFSGCYDLQDTTIYRQKDENNKFIKVDIPENIKHIDQEKSYSNSKKSQFYTGFLGKIREYRKMNTFERQGLYYIDNLDFSNSPLKDIQTKLNFYKNKSVYPKPDLDCLTFYNVKFNVFYGCVGDTYDFEWTEDMKTKKYIYNEKVKVPLYSKMVGDSFINKPVKTLYFNGDKKHLEFLSKNNNVYYPDNGKEALVNYEVKEQMTYQHFTSYILSYQRTQMLEQLLEMDLKKVIRIVVDGIYYEEHPVILKNTFRQKEDRNFKNYPDTSYIHYDSEEFTPENFGEERELFKKTLYKGAGGNGKTHLNLTDRGLVDILFLAPSWYMCSEKKKEYPNINFDIAPHQQLFQENLRLKLKDKYSTLIIDECSMITDKQKDEILEYFTNENIIFCGDIHYQLPPIVEGKEMNDEGFDKVIELTKNYRFKDDKIKALIKQVREYIRLDKDFKPEKLKINRITKEELKNKYESSDYILGYTNKLCDTYTDMFKHLKKYKIKQNYPHNDLYNGQITFEKKDKIDMELRHGFTIHIIQGKTCKENIYIDLNSLKGWRMTYTALSRAKNFNQLHFII